MPFLEMSKTNTTFLFCVGIALLVGIIAAQGVFESVEVGVLDIRMRQRSKPLDPRLAIIEIDQYSENQVGERWPWQHRRHYLAQMVYTLTDAGAKSGGLFVWFDREGENQADEELANALRQSPFAVVQPYASYPASVSGISQIDAWIDLPRHLQNDVRGHFAFSNLDTEERLYKVQLLAQQEKAQKEKVNHYALDLWLICHYFGIGAEDIQLKESFWHGKYLQIPHPDGPDERTLKIPIDSRGRLLVNFSDDTLATESFMVVHQRSNPSNFDSERELEQGLKANATRYGGRIVLVGVTAYPPPVKTRFGEQTELSIHAHAINTILTGSFFFRLPKPMKFVYMLLMCLFFAFAITTLDQRGGRAKFLWASVFCFGLHALIVAIVATTAIWVDFVGPSVALLLCSVTTLITFSNLERQEAELKHRRSVEELKDAREMQRSLMPTDSPHLEGFEIAGICQPASEVSGDFLTYLWLDEAKTQLGIVLMDVVGHGMKAAAMAFLANGMLQSESRRSGNPGAIMTELHQSLRQTLPKGTFVATGFLQLAMTDKTVTCFNAGIPEPVLLRDGKVHFLTIEGDVPLGAPLPTRYVGEKIALASGDVLLFFSDGLPEAEAPARGMYAQSRMKTAFEMLAKRKSSAKGHLEAIIADVQAYTTSPHPEDDLTLIVVKVL